MCTTKKGAALPSRHKRNSGDVGSAGEDFGFFVASPSAVDDGATTSIVTRPSSISSRVVAVAVAVAVAPSKNPMCFQFSL